MASKRLAALDLHHLHMSSWDKKYHTLSSRWRNSATNSTRVTLTLSVVR